MKLTDNFNRIHNYLRFSLTDKCNLNCLYCNPTDQNLNLLRNDEILTRDESLRLIRIFVNQFEFKKIRFTGGEPLARKDIIDLISALKPLHECYGLEIGITTNGTMLFENLIKLKDSGVTRLNISLDSLDKFKFQKITGKDKLRIVLESINLAEELGFCPLKINCVVMKGINDDEILDFIDYFKNKNINVRFIEYMPFSGNFWNEGKFLSYTDIKSIIENKYSLIPLSSMKSEVANNFQIAGYSGSVSFISSISNHFCEGCNRLRITSEGNMKLCLFSAKDNELNLKEYLRDGKSSDKEIAEIISKKLQNKEYVHPGIEDLLKLEKNNMLSIGG